jgi:hypothetical protein
MEQLEAYNVVENVIKDLFNKNESLREAWTIINNDLDIFLNVETDLERYKCIMSGAWPNSKEILKTALCLCILKEKSKDSKNVGR